MSTRTITDAIIEVLKKDGKELSIKEISKGIIDANLYQFKASNPEHIVRNQLRRHCDNIQLKTDSKIKHFTCHPNGTYGLKK